MSKPPPDDGLTPMQRARAKKRAAGLIPKEMWIHRSRDGEEFKRAEARLQKPKPEKKPEAP